MLRRPAKRPKSTHVAEGKNPLQDQPRIPAPPPPQSQQPASAPPQNRFHLPPPAAAAAAIPDTPPQTQFRPPPPLSATPAQTRSQPLPSATYLPRRRTPLFWNNHSVHSHAARRSHGEMTHHQHRLLRSSSPFQPVLEMRNPADGGGRASIHGLHEVNAWGVPGQAVPVSATYQPREFTFSSPVPRVDREPIRRRYLGLECTVSQVEMGCDESWGREAWVRGCEFFSLFSVSFSFTLEIKWNGRDDPC